MSVNEVQSTTGQYFTKAQLASDAASQVKNEALFQEASSEVSDSSALSQRAGEISASSAENDAALTENQTNQTETKGVIDTLKDGISTLTASIAETVSAIGEKAAEIVGLQSQKSNVEAQASSLAGNEETQSQATALQQQAAEIASQISQAESEKTELEATKAEDEGEKTNLEDNKKTEEAKLDNLQTEETGLEQEAQEIEADADGTNSDAQSGAGEAEQTEAEAQAELNEEGNSSEEAGTTVPQDTQPAAPTTEAPTAEAPTYQPAAQETPQEQQPVNNQENNTPSAEELSDRGVSQDVITRIENNESTDYEMATVIVNEYFDAPLLDISEEEIIGMDARDAINLAAESLKTQEYSKTVYTSKVSTKTDSATVEENQAAISDFMESYSEATNKLDAPNIVFLSLTDKSNYETVSNVADRLNDGEYILTREIEKNTRTADSIQVSTEETENTEEQASKTNGEDLLRQLKSIITDDVNAKEDKNDDILTQKEYDEEENFFNSSDNYTTAYKQMVEDAKQYGIYADVA